MPGPMGGSMLGSLLGYWGSYGVACWGQDAGVHIRMHSGVKEKVKGMPFRIRQAMPCAQRKGAKLKQRQGNTCASLQATRRG